MIDPYKNTSYDCRQQAKDRSYENSRTKIATDIISLMVEHKMTHVDMAEALRITPEQYKKLLWDDDLRLSFLNQILDVFSHELVRIFRRRWPATHN
jgi:hypothetical protein